MLLSRTELYTVMPPMRMLGITVMMVMARMMRLIFFCRWGLISRWAGTLSSTVTSAADRAINRVLMAKR